MITQEQEYRLIALLDKIKEETKCQVRHVAETNGIYVITDYYQHVQTCIGGELPYISASRYSDDKVKISYHAGVELENVIQHLEKEVPNAIKLIND